MTGFYGHWHVSHRKYSWELMNQIGAGRTAPWCILGDFNELLFSHEMTSELQRSESQIRQFRDVVDNLNLVEISMGHTDYTWWNKRSSAQVVWGKLDKCFGNNVFRQHQPYSHVVTIPMVTFDHHAIKLIFKKFEGLIQTQRLSRFEPWWLIDEACHHLIVEE